MTLVTICAPSGRTIPTLHEFDSSQKHLRDSQFLKQGLVPSQYKCEGDKGKKTNIGRLGTRTAA